MSGAQTPVQALAVPHLGPAGDGLPPLKQIPPELGSLLAALPSPAQVNLAWLSESARSLIVARKYSHRGLVAPVDCCAFSHTVPAAPREMVPLASCGQLAATTVWVLVMVNPFKGRRCRAADIWVTCPPVPSTPCVLLMWSPRQLPMSALVVKDGEQTAGH